LSTEDAENTDGLEREAERGASVFSVFSVVDLYGLARGGSAFAPLDS
jgi:hypothetical protein